MTYQGLGGENAPGLNDGEQSPLHRLYARVPHLTRRADHDEMWGVDFQGLNSVSRNTPRTIVLQKFLRANDDDVDEAAEQFFKALAWRKATNPRAKLDLDFNPQKFKGMGYVSHYRTSNDGSRVVVTWNMYGTIRDPNLTFEDMREFEDFRIALMELAIIKLGLHSAPAPSPVDGPDSYQIVQVHDCEGVSPWQICPRIKQGIQKTVEMFQDNYPELLAYNHFVKIGMLHNLSMKMFKLLIPPRFRHLIGADIGKFKADNNRLEAGRKLFSSGRAYIAWHHTLPTEYGGTLMSLRAYDTVRFRPDPSEVAPEDIGNLPQDGPQDEVQGHPQGQPSVEGPEVAGQGAAGSGSAEGAGSSNQPSRQPSAQPSGPSSEAESTPLPSQPSRTVDVPWRPE